MQMHVLISYVGTLAAHVHKPPGMSSTIHSQVHMLAMMAPTHGQQSPMQLVLVQAPTRYYVSLETIKYD